MLRKVFGLPSFLLETPNWWIVHGFDENLDLAMRAASLDMLGLLNEHVACRATTPIA